MTFFPAAGILTILFFDIHPDWFFIPGGSAPQGLWRIVDHDGATLHDRGNWIIVCPPVSKREHDLLFVNVSPDDEICTSRLSLKQIAAIPGDQVIVKFPYVFAPLRSVQAVDLDGNGVSLPRPANGLYSVDEGTYWVLTEAPRSIDSRYYGPITTADIVKTVEPVWTVP